MTKFVLTFLSLTMAFVSCTHEPVLVNGAPPYITPPPPGANTICFESDVLPIFVSNCAKSGCHDAITREEGFQLDNYAGIMKGIRPNNAAESKHWKLIITTNPGDRMPPPPAAPLTVAQKDSIYKWILQGAPNTTNCASACNTNNFTYSAAVAPILQSACTGCHSGSSPSAGINLTTYADVEKVASNGRLLGSIKHQSGYVPMPTGGKLSDCQITQISKWIDAGKLNN
jgi:hypothetical protein